MMRSLDPTLVEDMIIYERQVEAASNIVAFLLDANRLSGDHKETSKVLQKMKQDCLTAHGNPGNGWQSEFLRKLQSIQRIKSPIEVFAKEMADKFEAEIDPFFSLDRAKHVLLGCETDQPEIYKKRLADLGENTWKEVAQILNMVSLVKSETSAFRTLTEKERSALAARLLEWPIELAYEQSKMNMDSMFPELNDHLSNLEKKLSEVRIELAEDVPF